MIFKIYRTDACKSFGFDENYSLSSYDSPDSSWTEFFFASCVCWASDCYVNNMAVDNGLGFSENDL